MKIHKYSSSHLLFFILNRTNHSTWTHALKEDPNNRILAGSSVYTYTHMHACKHTHIHITGQTSKTIVEYYLAMPLVAKFYGQFQSLPTLALLMMFDNTLLLIYKS